MINPSHATAVLVVPVRGARASVVWGNVVWFALPCSTAILVQLAVQQLSQSSGINNRLLTSVQARVVLLLFVLPMECRFQPRCRIGTEASPGQRSTHGRVCTEHMETNAEARFTSLFFLQQRSVYLQYYYDRAVNEVGQVHVL